MSQPPSSYGTYNSAVSRGVKHQQQHITQSQTRLQNIDMLSYNSSNNNNNGNSHSNITVVTETGGNTLAIANSTTLDQNTSISNLNTNTGAIPKEKIGKSSKLQQPRKPPPTIETFWPTILQEVQNAVIDSKHQSLPLARIKKIMKLDENAKMIAAEAPTLFAKACEFFIQELTMRAWIHTDESKRRTLQRSDIAQAIANYDQFDFLIDIVPREDIKPPNHRRHHNDSTSASNNATASATNSPASSNSTMTTTVSNVVTGEILNVTGLPVENISTTAVATAQPTTATIGGNLTQTQPTQMLTAAATTSHPTPQLQIIQQTAHPQQHLQYFITLPGQQSGQAQLVHQLQLQHQQQQQHLNNGLATGTPLTAASLNLVAQQPQQLILTAANPAAAQAANVVQHQQQTALLQNIAQQQHAQQHQHPQQQQVQLLQQVMLTPNGELTNMPIAINANQLNLLRLQMQQHQQQQQQQQHHQQQVIIPTHLLTAQQILQLQAQAQNHAQANTATTTHIVHHQPHQTTQQQQQQQQHQQQQTQLHPQTTTTTNNIYINSNTIATNPTTSGSAAASSMVSTDRNMGSTFRNNC